MEMEKEKDAPRAQKEALSPTARETVAKLFRRFGARTGVNFDWYLIICFQLAASDSGISLEMPIQYFFRKKDRC